MENASALVRNWLPYDGLGQYDNYFLPFTYFLVISPSRYNTNLSFFTRHNVVTSSYFHHRIKEWKSVRLKNFKILSYLEDETDPSYRP